MRRLRLVLNNIRSSYNVGAILRTAEGLGAEAVIYAGYTPRYDDARQLPHLREKLNQAIAKSALGAEKAVEQRGVENLAEFLEQQRAGGWQIVGLENNLSASEQTKRIVLGSTSAILNRAAPTSATTTQNRAAPASAATTQRHTAPTPTVTTQRHAAPAPTATTLSQQIILVLGEEVYGIPAPLRPLMEAFLEIPMRGQKESFNVSVAAAIAMWELLK